MQYAITTIRGDLLPAALDVWGVAFAARLLCCHHGGTENAEGGFSGSSGAKNGVLRARRVSVVTAAVFFALAFIAKETTIFGFAAAVAALLFAGRRREAGRLAAVAIGLMAVLFLAACALSGGRILSNLLHCGSGGLTLASVLAAPRMNYFIFRRDPVGTFFLVLAFGALLGSGPFRFALGRHEEARMGGRAVWKSLPALWFIAATGVTVAMVASPGISWNHFIDAQVAAIVFLAVLFGRGAEAEGGCGAGFSLRPWAQPDSREMNPAPQTDLVTPSVTAGGGCATNSGNEPWRSIGACILALTAVLGLGGALFELHGPDIQPRRRQLQEAFAIASKSGKPVLSEDPTLLVANGVRPVMADPFTFRILQMKDRALAAALWRDIERHRFGAVVLRSDPRTPNGQAWQRDMHFGPGFADRLMQSYSFSTEHYGYLIFVPKPPGQD
jgi:hypothetical protein